MDARCSVGWFYSSRQLHDGAHLSPEDMSRSTASTPINFIAHELVSDQRDKLTCTIPMSSQSIGRPIPLPVQPSCSAFTPVSCVVDFPRQSSFLAGRVPQNLAHRRQFNDQSRAVHALQSCVGTTAAGTGRSRGHPLPRSRLRTTAQGADLS